MLKGEFSYVATGRSNIFELHNDIAYRHVLDGGNPLNKMDVALAT